MKILYSLPHPADRLGTQGAGHLVRAAALIEELRGLGHAVIQMQAAADAGGGTAVRAYRSVVKRLIPRPLALALRDWGRIRFGKAYGGRLLRAVRQHQPDVILETHIAFSLGGKIASQQSGVPLALDDCAPAREEEQQYGVGLKAKALAIHREVTGHASLLVAVNETLRRRLIEGGALSDKVITVPNGIDPEYFNARPDAPVRRLQLNISAKHMVIVFVGSFQPYHRVDLLLQALRLLEPLDSVHLLLVGSGQTYEQSRRLASSLGLSNRVTFTGAVDYEDVASFIAAGDIAVMPATNDYANPMKIYEYMAMGKPVVAPRQSNITDIVSDRQDALLFEPESPSALANTLTLLIKNTSLRNRLGEEARKVASTQTWRNRAVVLQDALLRVVRDSSAQM